MHLPTYIFLMVSAVVYGLYKTIVLWKTNWFLFSVSVFITIVTVVNTILQSFRSDNFEFKWLLWYTIPVALIAVSSLMQNTEFTDSTMRNVGITPPPHMIPGTSQDYKNAATGHYISIIFPFIAWLISKFVNLIIENFWKNNRS